MTRVSSKDIIKAILTNPNYNEDEKSTLVEELLEELKREYPELKYHATKEDVKEVDKKLSETELRLTKEIEEVRKEIKEVELRLTQEIEEVRKEIKDLELRLTQMIEETRKEIKEVELRLTQEIEEVRKEIKEVELRLTQKIEEGKLATIKWVVGFLIAQTGILVGALIGFMKVMG